MMIVCFLWCLFLYQGSGNGGTTSRHDLRDHMGLIHRLHKLQVIMTYPHWISVLLQHRVAAATEHLSVLRDKNLVTIVDIGANRGQFALTVRRCCPHANIHAFEPLAVPDDGPSRRQVDAGGQGGSGTDDLD